MKKILKRVGIGLLAAVVLLAAGLGWMFRKEIQTLNSIRKVDDYGMYQICLLYTSFLSDRDSGGRSVGPVHQDGSGRIR